nr:MAG TPA: hypothetical protein [Caudoviricetes sp.]
MIMAADYSILFQTHPTRIFLLLRNKIPGPYALIIYLTNLAAKLSLLSDTRCSRSLSSCILCRSRV